MCKKVFICFLLLALINFLVGCYSSELVTVPEYNQIEKEDKPDEIRVITKGAQEYHFSDSNFYIEKDTLYGRAVTILTDMEQPFEGRFVLSEIKYIQFIVPDGKYSIVSVSQYLKIETESGKPDAIYVTKNDYTRYHFMSTDYYIKNDTLYGKGKLLSSDKTVVLNNGIALSEIESIEFENFNWLTTSLLGLGIAAIAFITFITVVILSGNWGPST